MKKVILLSGFLLSLSVYAQEASKSAAKCPFMAGAEDQTISAGQGMSHSKVSETAGTSDEKNAFTWWPNQLDLSILRQNSGKSDPMGKDFDYTKAFLSLDIQALKNDIKLLMKQSQDWSQCRYLPHRRWQRRSGFRSTTFCATQQLAR